MVMGTATVNVTMSHDNTLGRQCRWNTNNVQYENM